MKGQTIKDFLMSKALPSISIPLFTVVVYVFNYVNPQNPISLITIVIILLVLIFWIIIRVWLIERDFPLIEEYSSLMKHLEELSSANCDSRQVLHEAIEYSYKNLKWVSPCWKTYFELKLRSIDTTSIELNKTFDEIIRNPYCLLWKDTDLIGKKFAKLFRDTKALYEDVSGKIPIHEPYNTMIKDKYNKFIDALNNSLNKFDKIRIYIPVTLKSPLVLPLSHRYGWTA